MTNRRPSRETIGAISRQSGDMRTGRMVLLVLLVLITPVALSAIADRGHAELTGYTNRGFTGHSQPLERTSGACRSLDRPVRSVSNEFRSTHAMLFSDAACTNPVSVLAPRQRDLGVVEGPFDGPVPDESQPSLLGEYGALSYRTLDPQGWPRRQRHSRRDQADSKAARHHG